MPLDSHIYFFYVKLFSIIDQFRKKYWSMRNIWGPHICFCHWAATYSFLLMSTDSWSISTITCINPGQWPYISCVPPSLDVSCLSLVDGTFLNSLRLNSVFSLFENTLIMRYSQYLALTANNTTAFRIDLLYSCLRTGHCDLDIVVSSAMSTWPEQRAIFLFICEDEFQ